MEHLYKRKPNLLFFWFLLPFLLYTGYAVGKLEGEEISISNLQEITLYSLTHPWPFKVTTLTGKAVLILLLIWGFGIIWYVGNYRNLIPGLEYGSAKFAELKQVNEKLEDIDDSMNKILSQNIRMSINTRKTGLNNNVKLKCFVGVTDEKDIADLTDMEEREILATKHLHNMEIVRKLKTDSNIAD